MTILWIMIAFAVLVAACAVFYRRRRRYRGVPVSGGRIGRTRREARMDTEVKKWSTGL